LDATVNYGAHSKFVEKWLAKLEAEELKTQEPTPEAEAETTEATATATAEEPAAPAA
jgi:peroxiredoxin Q/BCP